MVFRDEKNNVLKMAVMAADRKINWKKLKQVLNLKKLSLAESEEVFKLTKCIPGAVPPFGSLFKIETFCDESLKIQGNSINFNCGLRTASMNLATEDYLELEKPVIL